ncbi:hypothetical protein SAMN04487902_1114 [Prevotella sp. ne3005]|uniref:hypothetical protein n=1 Tax=Prevotella sp. ne3005 TaxID=1761887 RepID=UPI0008AA8476|nr:hypothetical protein [Prevotella sp. ne3005]SEN29308.1 hypothetical protein SAMN04487902_1114 [Prevotella sp. ne3005]
MKTKIKNLLGAAIMMVLPLSFTSCDDILGHWEKKPVPVQAFMFKQILDTGGTLNVKFNFSGTDYSVTFKKVGEKYQVQADGSININDYALNYKDGLLVLNYMPDGNILGQIFFDPEKNTFYIINDLGWNLTFDGKVTVNEIQGALTNACPKKAQIVDPDDATTPVSYVYYSEGETWQNVIDRSAISSVEGKFTAKETKVLVTQGTYAGTLKNNDGSTDTNVSDPVSDELPYKLKLAAPALAD